MADKFVLQARELLADELEKKGLPVLAKAYRDGGCDRYTAMTVLTRVIREQPAEPTFEQRCEAMRAATGCPDAVAITWLYAYDRHLAAIMAPPVDPLVEAVAEANAKNLDMGAFEYAAYLREALAARNHEIREVRP